MSMVDGWRLVGIHEGNEMSTIQCRQWESHRGDVLDSKNGFDVIECGPCQFKHIVPVPTVEELDAGYREDYYAIEKPGYVERYREDLDWNSFGMPLILH